MIRKMGLPEWGLLVATSALFASSFPFHKVALTGIPPFTIAAGRVLLALPVCWVVLRAGGGRLPPLGRGWIPLVVLGMIGVSIPYVAMAFGQQYIPSGLAAILFSTMPLFTMVLAPMFLPEEPFTVRRGLGVALGFSGVVLVIGPSVLAGVTEHLKGELIILIPPVCYALFGIYVRKNPGISPLVMTTGEFLVAAVVLVPLSLVVDGPWNLSPSPGAVGSLVVIALMATALPTVMVFGLVGRVGATSTSLTAYFIPVFAVLMGALLLREWLPWQAFAGLALVLGGAAVVGHVGARKPKTTA